MGWGRVCEATFTIFLEKQMESLGLCGPCVSESCRRCPQHVLLYSTHLTELLHIAQSCVCRSPNPQVVLGCEQGENVGLYISPNYSIVCVCVYHRGWLWRGPGSQRHVLHCRPTYRVEPR